MCVLLSSWRLRASCYIFGDQVSIGERSFHLYIFKTKVLTRHLQDSQLELALESFKYLATFKALQIIV